MDTFNPYQPKPPVKKKKKPGPKSKPKPRPKKRGRKRIPRLFDEVPLGYNLRLKAPLEYDLIMQVVGNSGAPDADLIEAISYSSKNPFFRTEEFRWMLIRYRQEGCFSEHPKRPPTPQQIVQAIKTRNSIAKGLVTN